MSTFAYTLVVSRSRWPKRSEISFKLRPELIRCVAHACLRECPPLCFILISVLEYASDTITYIAVRDSCVIGAKLRRKMYSLPISLFRPDFIYSAIALPTIGTRGRRCYPPRFALRSNIWLFFQSISLVLRLTTSLDRRP